MSIYDIVMLVIFFGSVLFGYRKGLAWQIASLAAIGLSYFVAVNFRNPVAQLISVEAPWNQFAAMLILFLGTSLVVWTIYASTSKSIKRLELKGFDRQAGAILGVFKGGILCMWLPCLPFHYSVQRATWFTIQPPATTWLAAFNNSRGSLQLNSLGSSIRTLSSSAITLAAFRKSVISFRRPAKAVSFNKILADSKTTNR